MMDGLLTHLSSSSLVQLHTLTMATTTATPTKAKSPTATPTVGVDQERSLNWLVEQGCDQVLCSQERSTAR